MNDNTEITNPSNRELEDTTTIDSTRELTAGERESLLELIEIANTHLIDSDWSRQTAIDALSIAVVLVKDRSPSDYGIAPGNVPESALPSNYDTKTEGHQE